MKATWCVLSIIGVLISCDLVESNKKPSSNTICQSTFGLDEAMNCAAVASDIACYGDEWPEGTNSTLFFELIEGNENLTSISFCFVQVDSLPSSISKVPNLEFLQLSSGSITSIPKEIGKLKKLRTLILGTSKDECGGNKISFIPQEIGMCESLERLGLAYSEVVDLPVQLKNCKKLKQVDLFGNTSIGQAKLEELGKRFPHVEFITE